MTITPNWFAYFALASWPAVALYFYVTRPLGQATLWTVLGGYLLLPVGTSIKFAMIPEFDKYSISTFAALIGCVLVARRVPRVWFHFGLAEVLSLIFLFSPFITSELNSDSIVEGSRILPGETLYDALSAAAAQAIALIPFILGRNFLRNRSDSASIMRILVIAGLAYSLLMLFEIRMTPQLHIWTYGYFPHSWIQQYRDEGFRPVVFLGHGLIVAFFAMTTSVAAAALWRTKTRIVRLSPAGVTAYLSAVLVLCKTLSAILYAVILVPLVRWGSPRAQLRVAMILVSIALVYPIFRTTVPTAFLLDIAGTVSAERQASLNTRFENEKVLLEHADQRFWFGWGRWGRNRVYTTEYGESVTDGRWIITLGSFGIFGFFAEFGLLSLSVFHAASALKFTESKESAIYLGALALIVSIGIFDLLPNGILDSWKWLVAGALFGRAEELATVARQRTALKLRVQSAT